LAGDIIVAGRNFGCGSSREHAPLAIKSSGVGAIIASSFARIFYRSSYNIGLPLLESVDASERIGDGERLEVDLGTGMIKSLDRGDSFQPVHPGIHAEARRGGGLVEYIRKNKLNK